MRVILLKSLKEFCRLHPDVAPSVQAWAQEARASRWRSPQDIRGRYGQASFLPGNRVVFNLKGNAYRLVVAVSYRFEAVYIKFIGPHAEYDTIDAATVDRH